MNLVHPFAAPPDRRHKPIALVLVGLIVALLLAGTHTFAAQPRAAMLEPAAGTWNTWLLSSGSELRLPAPPNRSATQAELRQLQALARQRNAAAAQIARWTNAGAVYRWNELAREIALKRGVVTPPGSRIFALLNVAIYDATIAAWDSKYTYNRARPSVQFPALSAAVPVPNSPSYPSEDAVIAAAASEVLSFLFPNDADFFRSMAVEAGRTVQIAGLAYPSDVQAGAQLGAAVAQRVIAYAKTDGAAQPWDGNRPTGPGYWTGDNPVLPQAGAWKTWALTSGSELRPGPPAAHTSGQIAAELQELRDYPRTPPVNANAFFWEYGAGGSHFWAYWNDTLARKVIEYGWAANPPRAARAFLLPNIAMYDVFVACWDAKYTYWFIRPHQLDPTFQPLFTPPAYPAYPSAHGCLSQAVGSVMAYLFPNDLGHFYSLVDRAAESRIAAGLHYRSDVTVGRDLGWAVAQKVIARAEADGS